MDGCDKHASLITTVKSFIEQDPVHRRRDDNGLDQGTLTEVEGKYTWPPC